MDNVKSSVAAIIFDLDGTLLDSLQDVADAGNAALEEHGFAAHPASAYRFFLGEGMETLARRALPRGVDEDVAAGVCARLREIYADNWSRRTVPYPGVRAMLSGLAAKGLPLAVLSNKPHELTRLVTRHYFPEVFAHAQGSPPGGRAKPDPALALEAARLLGAPPERVFFVGDSGVDMDTATAAGMTPVGALWGFRPREELLAHGARLLLPSPEDLLRRV